MSYVTNLECTRCHRSYEARKLHNVCVECHAPLFVNYDLEALRDRWNKTSLAGRVATMWRYREVLPVEKDENVVTLGEGFTPLLKIDNIGRKLGLKNLFVKDESRNPTGTFKARGLSVAVSMAKELGVKKIAIPTAGNAGGALAAYAARAGLEAFVFMPDDVPNANKIETQVYGAHTTLIKGLIKDAGEWIAKNKEAEGWFDLSTLKEPYRVEGKKTMGYEIAEQFGWSLPDVIVYPTGGGTGPVGIWKAFSEMERLGWIGKDRPRIALVQSEGCAPIVRAFEQGREKAEEWPGVTTVAAGLRVPRSISDFLVLKILRDSRGIAVAVSDEQILQDVRELSAREGIFPGPEGAACLSALKVLIDRKWVRRDETIMLLLTGSGLKYLDLLSPRL